MAGTAIILLVTALILPFVLRFGMNKAMRIVPVVIVLLFVVAVPLAGDALQGGQLAPVANAIDAFISDPANQIVVCAAVAIAVLAVYAASCLIAARMYRAKEL